MNSGDECRLSRHDYEADIKLTTMRSIGTGIFILLLNRSLMHSLTRRRQTIQMAAIINSAQLMVAILLNKSMYV